MNKIVAVILCLFLSVPVHSAMTFDEASTEWIDIGDQAGLFCGGNFTMSIWVRRNGTPGSIKRFFGDYTTIGGTCTGVLSLTTGNLITFFWENPGGAFPTATSTGAIPDLTWVHVAGVWDGTTRQIYINGVADGSNATAQARTDNGGNLGIGRPGSFASQYFNGDLDDARIYCRALSASEIATLAASRSRRIVTDGLVGWWKLNDGTDGTSAAGATIKDSAGGFTGTANNTPIHKASIWLNYW